MEILLHVNALHCSNIHCDPKGLNIGKRRASMYIKDGSPFEKWEIPRIVKDI